MKQTLIDWAVGFTVVGLLMVWVLWPEIRRWCRQRFMRIFSHRCSKCGVAAWVQCETCYRERHHKAID